ncbi:MAG TPA: hypothetical protein VNB86_08020 [Gaiellaceae bacterium]|jgi:hypothetical protein|nr:hypothetical protein [Gaiellaceae bacterium]
MRAAVAVALIALALPATAAARTALLPSPTTPLDTKLPLGASAAGVPPLLPANARVSSRQIVSVDVLADGTVVAVRVRHVLTLLGTGDFFFQVPAPARDARAAPGSQGEPGLRQGAVLWQGFANRRRVLAADMELDPAAAAPALPLRLELRDRVLVLRNATAVRARGFSAAARPAQIRRVLAGIARRPTEQPSVQLTGPVRGRSVVVDAPLRVVGSVGGSRFERLLGGPASTTARIPAREGARVRLVAEPVRLVPETRPPRSATGSELVFLATKGLLRLARTFQYNAFLAGPGVGAPPRTTYVYRTVTPRPSVQPPASDDDWGLPLALLLGAAIVVASGGLVVAWAHS